MDATQKTLSDITVFNKYAKFVPEKNRRETWFELCRRNMDMHIRKYPHMEDEIRHVYADYVMPKKVLPSMRSMQFGGRPIELSNVRINNCSYLPADDIAVFAETMFLLLSGTGVGYSVQTHHISKLPVVLGPKENKTRKWLISDSIEGWADAVKALVKAYFFSRPLPMFDYRDIRPKGAALITSGGKAPGPEPLRICLERLKVILDRAVGRHMKSIEVHDALCHIADAVLSGGIRRAAMIALFSIDDEEMLTCKGNVKLDNWELEKAPSGYQGFCIYKGERHDVVLSDWDYERLTQTGRLPWYFFEQQRGRANNSVVLHRKYATEEQFKAIWKKVEESQAGEPGIFWTNDYDWGTNPCCVSKMTQISVRGSVTNGQTEVWTIEELVAHYHAFPTEQIEVQCYNHEREDIEFKRVKQVALMRKNAPTVQVIAGSCDLFCTPDHKIYVDTKGYIEAQNIETGDSVLTSSGYRDCTVEYQMFEEDVYDLEVDDNHNFFADGILVHNCEIGLRANSFCNLSEINVSDVDTQEELNKRAAAAAFLGTLQAGYTDFHYLRPQWQETTEKERLLGVSMTGIGSGKVLGLNVREASAKVKEENARVADLIGINRSARLTTVKPAGTTSLTLGTSSGIHAWHAPYYVRRMRVGKTEPLYGYIKEHMPELVEDCRFKPDIEAVLSIPQKAPEGSIFRTEDYKDLLERVKRFNKEWVFPGHVDGANSHNVSCTISLKDDEWEECGEWMWKHRNFYNGISVLPYDGGTYVQAPFEDITEERFHEMLEHLATIDLTKVIETVDATDLKGEVACGGGACEVI